MPGLAIAVVKDDQTVFARGYGTTSIEAGSPVDQHTLFSIGSTTKAMTALGIGMLVDEGKLAWDDPVSEHLPQFRLADPVATATLRVRDLLTHNAGVPNTDVLWYEQANDLDTILERMQHVELYAPMYSGFTYQNVMYAAAGKLTEVISGLPWHEFIAQRIFEPLGMKRSVARLADTQQRDNVAEPHYRIDGSIAVIDNATVDSVAAAGSVWSSVDEMAKWARFLLRGCKTEDQKVLLQPNTCAELFRPQAIIDVEMYPAMSLYEHQWFTYALGWFQTDYNGRALNFHSGSIDGLVALHGLVRSENLGVYILANLDHAEVRHALMYQALDLYDPRIAKGDRRDWNREVKDLFDGFERQRAEQTRAAANSTPAAAVERPQLANDAYLGHYSDPFLGEISVAEGPGIKDPGQLELRFGNFVCTLQHTDGDSFSCPWAATWRGSANVVFIKSGPSNIGSVRLDSSEFKRRESERREQ